MIEDRPFNPHAPDWDTTAPPGITLREYADAWLDMAPHVEQLVALAATRSVIVEFGVRGAVSTWSLLEGMPTEGRLISVDIIPDRRWYDDHQPDWNGYVLPVPARVREDPRWTLIIGDSVKVALPEHADLVMIDSSHEYAQTVAELHVAAGLTPSCIVLHDYLYAETPDVRRAVDEFIAEGDYRMRVLYPSTWGLAVLVPR